MSRLRAWWDGRTPREQWMVGGLGFALALALGWYGVVAPLGGAARAAEARYARVAVEAAEAERLAGEIARLEKMRGGTPGRAPGEAVRQAAGAAGLVIAREQPQARGALEVWLEPAPAATVFAWLVELHRQHGVEVRGLETHPGEGGIEVRAVLQGAGA